MQSYFGTRFARVSYSINHLNKSMDNYIKLQLTLNMADAEHLALYDAIRVHLSREKAVEEEEKPAVVEPPKRTRAPKKENPAPVEENLTANEVDLPVVIEEDTGVTREDVQAALRKKAVKYKKEITAIMTGLGLTAMSQMQPEHYKPILDALNALA